MRHSPLAHTPSATAHSSMSAKEKKDIDSRSVSNTASKVGETLTGAVESVRLLHEALGALAAEAPGRVAAAAAHAHGRELRALVDV